MGRGRDLQKAYAFCGKICLKTFSKRFENNRNFLISMYAVYIHLGLYSVSHPCPPQAPPRRGRAAPLRAVASFQREAGRCARRRALCPQGSAGRFP